jgi:hypothetical protein
MSKILDEAFAVEHIDTAVDALLNQLENPTQVRAEAPESEAPLAHRRPRAPNWFIPLPPRSFKYVSKSQLSHILRDKVQLLQKHLSLSDTFYFDRWITMRRKRPHKERFASIHRSRPNEETAVLGLDDIREHLDQLEEEKEAQKEAEREKAQKKQRDLEEKQNGTTVEDDGEENQGRFVKMLGRFVHNSIKRGRGVTAWARQSDETFNEVEGILPPSVPPRQIGSFDRDQNAISRRFVEQGWELLIRAQDDLFMLESLPPLPEVPPTDSEHTYELRVDTQDVQMSEVAQMSQVKFDFLFDHLGNMIPNSNMNPQSQQQQSQSQQQQSQSQQQSYNNKHSSTIQTEKVTYAQLFTVHNKLRTSLNRFFDELLELLDVQYTIQHIFNTMSAINLNMTPLNSVEQSLHIMCLEPISNLAIQYQLDQTTPLSQLPFMFPDLQLDIATINHTLDVSQYTSFIGFDTRFLKLLLPLPRSHALFAKALTISKQGQLPQFNRLLGFILQLLPDFMYIDTTKIVNHLSTYPTTTVTYSCDSPISKQQTNTKSPEDGQTPSAQTMNIPVPFCLFDTQYLQYSYPNHSHTALSQSSNQQLAESICEAIQGAQPHIIQRSCDQVRTFLLLQLELPYQHMLPFTTPPLQSSEDGGLTQLPSLPGFHPQLEQLGVFFGLLRDGLFGPIYRSFLSAIESVQVQLPVLLAQQNQLLSEIAQLMRYRDIFLVYGRGIQGYIRSLNNYPTILDVYNSVFPTPPNPEKLAQMLADPTPVTIESFDFVSVQSEAGLATLQLSHQQLVAMDKTQLGQYLHKTLSHNVLEVFQYHQMTEHKESLQRKQAEEQKITFQLQSSQNTSLHISNQLIMPSIVPLAVMFPTSAAALGNSTPINPAVVPTGNLNNTPEDGRPQVLPISHDVLEQQNQSIMTLIRDNLFWWLFLGIKTGEKQNDSAYWLTQMAINPDSDNTYMLSGGKGSLWNNIYDTDSSALQFISNHKVRSSQRYGQLYHTLFHPYISIPRQFLGKTQFSQFGRQQGHRKQHVHQNLIKALDASRMTQRSAIEKAIQQHRNDIQTTDAIIEQARMDVFSPNVHLPLSMRTFIDTLKRQNRVTKTIYTHSETRTRVETLISTLTLLAAFLPRAELYAPIHNNIVHILTLWLHVQKAVYLDILRATPVEDTPNFATFLNTTAYNQQLHRLLSQYEYDRVNYQVDTVVQRYAFILSATNQLRQFAQNEKDNYFNSLSQIADQFQAQQQRQSFPSFETGAKPVAPHQPIAVKGQWAEIQQQAQQQQQPYQQRQHQPRQHNNNNYHHDNRPHNNNQNGGWVNNNNNNNNNQRRRNNPNSQAQPVQVVQAQPVQAKPVQNKPQ